VLIQKNTTVVVARVPLANAPKKNWKEEAEENGAAPVRLQRLSHFSNHI
jgi:hypothetical protein